MKKKVICYIALISILFTFLNANVIPKEVSAKAEERNNTLQCNEYTQEVNIDNEKIIYLTFDDGPSYKITNRILDILKKYNVKATFFVVGSQIKDREEILKRIYEDGHSIGLHTYTHKYKKIYSSQEYFLKEMTMTSKEIEKIIHIKPMAIRFPGGSKKHLNKELLDKLHKENYKVYDWNANIADGVTPNLSIDQFFRKATNVKNKSQIILLMHCNYDNEKTCEALPKIIEYYRNLGYQFCTINDNTPEYYFRFK